MKQDRYSNQLSVEFHINNYKRHLAEHYIIEHEGYIFLVWRLVGEMRDIVLADQYADWQKEVWLCKLIALNEIICTADYSDEAHEAALVLQYCEIKLMDLIGQYNSHQTVKAHHLYNMIYDLDRVPFGFRLRETDHKPDSGYLYMEWTPTNLLVPTAYYWLEPVRQCRPGESHD